MNLNELFNRYEEMESDFHDLFEGMKYWKCPDLIVEEKLIPDELKVLEVFEKKDIAPLNGGENSKLHQNIVEYFVHGDENDQNPNEFIPLIPKKFVTYQTEKFFPGMYKITLIFGQKVRKENDWRFTDKVNVQKDEAYFIYDYGIQHYKQVSSKKSEWSNRMYERELIRNEAVKFIRYYQELKDTIWIKKQNPFDKTIYQQQFSDEIIKLNQKEFITEINFFLNLSKKYIYILYFFGLISKDHYHHLLKAFENQKDRHGKCLEYIVIEEENLIYELKTILNLPDNNPFSEVRYKMECLLILRKERVEDINIYNYMNGYVYIDIINCICYPNLSEIIRKISLYEMAANEESEKDIEMRIIEIARNVRKSMKKDNDKKGG